MERVLLRDGTEVALRPIREEDKDAVQSAFDRMSEDSRYKRFFTLSPQLSDRELAYLTEVDHHDHEALVAYLPGTGESLGVSRFVRSKEDPEEAEVATVVVDDWQSRGIGTLLIDRLSARAREEGIQRFTSELLASNRRAIDLFRRMGAVRSESDEPTYTRLTLELAPATGADEPLTHALRAAARGDLRGGERPLRPDTDS